MSGGERPIALGERGDGSMYYRSYWEALPKYEG